jgi:hypothetical protein
MTDRPRPDDRSGKPTPPPLDDAALGALVREAAESWRMPPQRIEQRTWRDRVDGPPARSGRLRRLAAAGALAAAATVVVAVGAIWLRQASETPIAGASTTPGESSRPSVTAEPSPISPAVSPLPAFATAGSPIGVPAVLVRAEGHQAVDLATGVLGPTLETRSEGESRFFSRPGGGWWCVCLTGDRPLSQGPTTVTVVVTAFDATGTEISTATVGTYGPGLTDPETAELGAPISVSAWPAAEPGRAFVGWAVRTADGWTSGVDLVDLTDGRIVATLRLPDLPLVLDAADAADGLRPTWADAPRITAAPGGASIVASQVRGITLDRHWFIDLDRLTPERWYVTIENDRFSPAWAFRTGEGTFDPAWCPGIFGEGFAGPEVFVAICPSEGVIRRSVRDGVPWQDIPIPGLAQDSFVTYADDGSTRYLWHPFSRTLQVVDLLGGRVTATLEISSEVAATGPSGDPLSDLVAQLRGFAGRLADRLAPPAAAKVFLDPALAISPDGRRLYLATVTGTSIESAGGSGGIVVIDTGTLAEVDRWAPLADVTSVAVSRDGSLVYVTGAPGVDASGRTSPEQQASLVVHDAQDGSARVIAGRLGGEYLTLDPTTTP